MKVLFVSDIHGSSYYAKKLQEICCTENPDKIVILGDLYYHGPTNGLTLEYNPMEVSHILNSLKDKLYVVKGNCDSLVDETISDFPFHDSLMLDIEGKKVFCTHGNKYHISNLPDFDFDIMAYGHFHTGFIKKDDAHIFINPGSISLPRDGTVHSYIIVDNGKIILKDIDSHVIDMLNMK